LVLVEHGDLDAGRVESRVGDEGAFEADALAGLERGGVGGQGEEKSFAFKLHP